MDWQIGDLVRDEIGPARVFGTSPKAVRIMYVDSGNTAWRPRGEVTLLARSGTQMFDCYRCGRREPKAVGYAYASDDGWTCARCTVQSATDALQNIGNMVGGVCGGELAKVVPPAVQAFIAKHRRTVDAAQVILISPTDLSVAEVTWKAPLTSQSRPEATAFERLER